MKVRFSYKDIEERVEFVSGLEKFIAYIVIEEHKKLGEIHYIFTSNQSILEINREFLNHHYYTDVITFSDNRKNRLSGEIFISLEQVRINAQEYQTLYTDELLRVIIHGLLHLVGYDDKSEKERIAMREKEDVYLCKFKSLI